MKSKEELLEENGVQFDKESGWVFDTALEYVEKAMSEHARECSIGFASWVGGKFYYEEDTDLWESFNDGEMFVVNGENCFRFSTSDLFQLYLETLK